MSKDLAYALNTKSGYNKESGQGLQIYSCFISGKARFLINMKGCTENCLALSKLHNKGKHKDDL